MAARKLVELAGSAVGTTLTADSVIILPTGSVEHHGPHLPLVTDALLAEAVATAAVEQGVADGLDLWLLPTLTYTKSDEHHWAPGTMWLNYDTLMSTLVDLGRSVAATPAKKLVFMNGHGGNSALLQVANRELRRRFGLVTFAMPAGLPVAGTRGVGVLPEEMGQSIHAGHAETSLVMHVRPDLVDLGLAERHVPEHLAGLEYIGINGKPVSFGWLSNDFGPTGVIGDPTQASAEAGRVIFEASVAGTVAALHEIAAFRHLP
ncbi:creatininase family protein [uncultured Friedmanniella sp.]|uniref:creatininase family protein n=1 Tax=uncultured Friedmanniella sp. TaxID=335381 RepID=UPI0035CB0573